VLLDQPTLSYNFGLLATMNKGEVTGNDNRNVQQWLGLPVALRKITYPPLLSNKSFRLIQLYPGSELDTISVHLLQSELQSAPVYDAISYVWGDSSRTVTINCDSQPLEITTNLHWALWRIRDPHVAQFVWADAICIDQSNIGERSSQVALMGSIYGQARKVYITMGEAHGVDDQNVASLMRDISSVWATAESRLAIGVIFRDDPRWGSISELMSCPWFSRVWVVQEAGLAKHPIMLYGNARCPYRELISIVSWARSQPWGSKYGITGWAVHAVWSDWTQIPAFPNVGLFDLLSHGAMLFCQDPRDRVYAFLGHPLARNADGSSAFPLPDYTKDYREVYQEVSNLLFGQIGLRLLSSVEHTETTIEESLSSWVVRWNVAEVMNDISQYHNHYQVYQTNEDQHSSSVIRGDKLITKGIYLETIDTSFQTRAGPGISTVLLRDRHSNTETPLLNILHSIVTGQFPASPIYKDNPQAALLKTLSAGNHRHLIPVLTRSIHDARANEEETNAFYDQMVGVCHNRCFASTKSGLFVLAPWLTQPGDICVVLFGAGAPFVLRPRGNGEYRLLGEAYIGGIMNGELKGMFSKTQLEGQEFVIS
jgi:hypothetical protein